RRPRRRAGREAGGASFDDLVGAGEQYRFSLSARHGPTGGGKGRGEVGDSRALAGTHLTLPLADASGPLPLPPKGRRGQFGLRAHSIRAGQSRSRSTSRSLRPPPSANSAS